MYFCCLEALANVGKHAPGASVTITLEAVPGELRFESPTTSRASTRRGSRRARDSANMADRIGALGGEIAWRSAPGVGTTVIGRTPVPHTAAAMPPARPVGLPRGRTARWVRCRGRGSDVARRTPPAPLHPASNRPRRLPDPESRRGATLGAVLLVARAELRTRWRGLVGLGLLLGLVGGVVLGAVAVADRTDTAYARLASANGLADAQVLLPAAHATVFDAVPSMPGVTASSTRSPGSRRSTRPRCGSSRSAAVPTGRPGWPNPSSSRAGLRGPTRPTRYWPASPPWPTWACTWATR